MSDFHKAVFAILIFFLAEFPAAGWAESREIGIVLPSRLNVRAQPRPDADVVAVLEKGNTFDVMLHVEGYLFIRLGDISGYVRNRSQYVRLQVMHTPGASSVGVSASQAGDIQRIQTEIQKRESEVQSFSEKERTVIAGLHDLGEHLSRIRRKIVRERKALKSMEAGLFRMEDQILAVNLDITERMHEAEGRLAALYRMQQMERIDMLAPSESFFDFLVRKRAVTAILDSDRRRLSALGQDLAALEELREKQGRMLLEKKNLEQELSESLRIADMEKRKQTEILQAIRREKKLALAAIESLSMAAESLNRQISGMPSSGESAPDLARYKGLLKMPVDGKVISRFGPAGGGEIEIMTSKSGIDIMAPAGTPIQAVSGGRILFADWFRGYGNMIIIDHGAKYFSVYAHAEELFKAKGDPVEAHEVIATVGETGSMDGAKLHFELRHQGTPLDPMVWLRHGS